jgi:hypothetical protein
MKLQATIHNAKAYDPLGNFKDHFIITFIDPIWHNRVMFNDDTRSGAIEKANKFIQEQARINEQAERIDLDCPTLERTPQELKDLLYGNMF